MYLYIKMSKAAKSVTFKLLFFELRFLIFNDTIIASSQPHLTAVHMRQACGGLRKRVLWYSTCT